MTYLELIFITRPAGGYQQDVLIDTLAGLGFDTFEDTDTGFKAYIPEVDFDKSTLDAALPAADAEFSFEYSVNTIAQQNWNEVWESNFEPIEVAGQVFVRATFHTPKPHFAYQVVIDPKMAFGTGHHQTTAMMMAWMLETDFKGKTVLDMGCGTGILAILAAKMGASGIVAIDYDEICYHSTIENAALNQIDNITPLCGSDDVIPHQQFDIILANINRNILTAQMPTYSRALKPGGLIFFSGFYQDADLAIITQSAAAHGMAYTAHKTDKNWVAAKFER